jgi:hypothetical protein
MGLGLVTSWLHAFWLVEESVLSTEEDTLIGSWCQCLLPLHGPLRKPSVLSPLHTGFCSQASGSRRSPVGGSSWPRLSMLPFPACEEGGIRDLEGGDCPGDKEKWWL